jgi:hypothetical protein
MSYVWSTEGPAFVYPACYRTENRFLTLRAAALFLFALIVLWLALVEPDAPSSGAAVLRVKAERGHPAAHIIAGLVMLLLGVVDLVTAARQRRVLLQPGQPASLTSELSRQSAGISAGAPQLLRMLGSGQVPMPALRGNWLGALQRLSPRLPGAPSGLVDYLRLRVSHLLFAAGLLVVLGLAWPLAAGAPPLALAALLVAGLAAALAARSAWIASEAPSPRVVAVVLLVALLAAVALARLGGVLPHVGRLQPLALPVSALLVVLCLLVIEGLGLLAGRAQVPGAPQVDLAAADASADVRSDAERLMQEVERELHRFWSEGIPNRRHAWEPPAAKPGDTELGALVLEESQPLPLAADRDGSTGTTPQPWLLVLDTLGLLLTVGGGVLWVIQTYTQMQDGAAAWHYAAPGTVLLVAGGYALRVAHLLWGRVETDSLMIWLQIKGQAVLADLEQPLRLRACLVKLRSVFYIDAEHTHGSRTLLRLQGDAASAQRFVAQVQAYAERTSAAVAAPAARAAAPAPAAVPTARPAAPASGRVNARFCPACGTPVFQGARFCQHCGQTLAP